MDLKDEIKVGDEVLCLVEKDIPSFIGKVWKVTGLRGNLVYCQNKELYTSPKPEMDRFPNSFPFKTNEIVKVSSLIKELLWVI